MIKKWAIGLIVSALLLVYHPALFAFWGSDDFIWLWFSADSSSLGHTLTNDLALSKLRLVVNAYFYLLYQLFHLQAFWYHLASLGLHAFNSVFLYRILLRLTSDFRLSMVSALILATHFALEESVFWVSAVSSLLVAGLGSISLWLLLKYAEKGSKVLLGTSYFVLALALLSKEEAVLFPIIMVIILKLAKPERPMTYGLKLLAVPFILSAVYLGLRIILSKPELVSSVIQLNPLAAISKLIYLVVNLFLPVRWVQDSFPSFWQKMAEFHHAGFIYPVALIALALVILILKLHGKLSKRSMAVSLIFLFSSLVFMLFSGYGQRFVYVPALSVSVLSATLLLNLSKKLGRHSLVWLTILVLALNFAVIQNRGAYWRQAGKETRKVLSQMGDILNNAPADAKIFFTDLPGVWHHVYMFHLGYPQVVFLFYPEHSGKVTVVDTASENLSRPESLVVYSYRNGKFEIVR
ncbi:MAG: hypothetical protein A2142_03680 [candidate division Zixibacteria bacterium RBG_16_48_11]|nr:MAG: hypothetical protein A2142_03680 [candidate division Zixibacteria bacterium RBG_16_48_11]